MAGNLPKHEWISVKIKNKKPHQQICHSFSLWQFPPPTTSPPVTPWGNDPIFLLYMPQILKIEKIIFFFISKLPQMGMLLTEECPELLVEPLTFFFNSLVCVCVSLCYYFFSNPCSLSLSLSLFSFFLYPPCTAFFFSSAFFWPQEGFFFFRFLFSLSLSLLVEFYKKKKVLSIFFFCLLPTCSKKKKNKNKKIIKIKGHFVQSKKFAKRTMQPYKPP